MVNEESMYLKSPKSYPLTAAVWLACFHVSGAWAQSEIKPEALPAEKPVELVYQSSFQNYQRYATSDIQPWKQSNDTVKDIGGWRAYAKEITQEPSAQPSTSGHSHGGRP